VAQPLMAVLFAVRGGMLPPSLHSVYAAALKKAAVIPRSEATRDLSSIFTLLAASAIR
jgi:hypothetical protein